MQCWVRPSHLQRWLLIFLFKVSTAVSITWYTSRAQRQNAMVSWISTTSLKLQSKTMPRFLTGLFLRDKIALPPSSLKIFPTLFPYFSSTLDFTGFKLILAKRTSFFRPWRILLPPDSNDVLTVGSFMKSLIGDCQAPNLDREALHLKVSFCEKVFNTFSF